MLKSGLPRETGFHVKCIVELHTQHEKRGRFWCMVYSCTTFMYSAFPLSAIISSYFHLGWFPGVSSFAAVVDLVCLRFFRMRSSVRRCAILSWRVLLPCTEYRGQVVRWFAGDMLHTCDSHMGCNPKNCNKQLQVVKQCTTGNKRMQVEVTTCKKKDNL